MAQTDAYSNLVSLIEARMGASFGATELTRLKHLINSRAYMIYRESDLWENMLVVGEERAVNDSVAGEPTCPYTGPVVDGGYGSPYDASVDSFIRIHKLNPWNDRSVNEWEFIGDANGARLVGYSATYGLSTAPSGVLTAAGDLEVTINSRVDAWVGGTFKLSGFDSDVIDINGIHTITGLSGYSAGNTVLVAAITDTTSNTWTIDDAEAVLFPGAFCTYKKRLNGTTYGDGAGESTAVPQEWFEPISYGVQADMLAADERFEASLAMESRYKYALQLELERLDALKAAQTVGQQIYTTTSEQGRAVSF